MLSIDHRVNVTRLEGWEKIQIVVAAARTVVQEPLPLVYCRTKVPCGATWAHWVPYKYTLHPAHAPPRSRADDERDDNESIKTFLMPRWRDPFFQH